MGAYSYLATEITSGDVIAELPLSKVSFESFVTDPGKLSGSLKFGSIGTAAEQALARIYKGGLDPVRCAIHVLRDGVPVWGGPIWVSGYSMASRTATVQAAEWWSLMRKRLIIDQQVFTTQDLHTIARALVTYTQGRGTFGITLDATVSGETMSITYEAHEVQQVAKAIETLGAQADGFELAVDISLSGDSLVRTLNLSHPTRGRSYEDTGLMFEHGRNLVDLGEQQDGQRMAGEVTGVGAGQGPATLISHQLPTVPPSGYPLIESVVSFKDVTDQDQLDALTLAEADRSRLPVRTLVATVLPDLPDLGSYRTGDEARFVIEPNKDPWWIDGLDERIRIIGIKVSPDDDGGRDQVDLTLDRRPETDATIQADNDRRLRALEATAA